MLVVLANPDGNHYFVSQRGDTAMPQEFLHILHPHKERTENEQPTSKPRIPGVSSQKREKGKEVRGESWFHNKKIKRENYRARHELTLALVPIKYQIR